jgi:hemerythrin-like metal-binding protein
MKTTTGGLLPEALVLGIPHVDAQHESIFCCVENLKFFCIESNALPSSIIHDLLDDVREHFRTEEAIARSARLDFAEHAEMHRQTLIAMSDWAELVLSEQRDVFSFLRYLEAWFERHIRDEDLPFAIQLHKVQGRSDKAQGVILVSDATSRK